MRHTAFTTALIGNLVRDIGAMITGVFVWRSGLWPRWVAIILLLALPLGHLVSWDWSQPRWCQPYMGW